MRIGDLANSYKDTPGKGRFAGNVYMYLERGRQDSTWHISAFSHDVEHADLAEVAAMWRRLDNLLAGIATDVEDKSAISSRRPIRNSIMDDIRVPVVEELVVGKRQEAEDRVRIHKEVMAEQQSVPVTRQHEEAVVERAPVSGVTDVDVSDAFREWDIDVPVMGEEAVVGKRVREGEEVRLRKEAVTEQQQVSDMMRKERVIVDRGGH